MQGSLKGSSPNPVSVEKQNIKGFVSRPDVSCLSFLLFPLFSVCSCCWICPPFRWLVAMLLSSLCSLALWWIVYGFPSSILHFCIDGLGFQWVLPSVSPQKPVLPPFWSSNWECCKWAPVSFFKLPTQIRKFFKMILFIAFASTVNLKLMSRASYLKSKTSEATVLSLWPFPVHNDFVLLCPSSCHFKHHAWLVIVLTWVLTVQM